MEAKGYTAFKTNGQYLLSSASVNGDKPKKKMSRESIKNPQIGTIRVFFEYDICGPATVIAQQVTDDKGKVTFRRWDVDQEDSSELLDDKSKEES